MVNLQERAMAPARSLMVLAGQVRGGRPRHHGEMAGLCFSVRMISRWKPIQYSHFRDSAPARLGLDTLLVMEAVGRIPFAFDLAQCRIVRAEVAVLPVLVLGVDIVLVVVAGPELAHRRRLVIVLEPA